METLADKAIDKLRQLPPEEQEHIAQIVLDEIDSERRWNELFARKGKKLEALAGEAMREYEAGFAEDLDPDKLGQD
jgi:hypothetical protein